MTEKTVQAHAARPDADHEGDRQCMSRRQFLLAGGAAVTLAAVGLPGELMAAPLHALRASYPKVKIARLSALKRGVPLHFNYPYPNVRNVLVKLGVRAGGGVGAEGDIVAFNQQCPHMGGPLDGTYKDAHQSLGPCPLHLTTFDLTRYGMVISGQATASLPQIVLDVQGDDIYAIGVQGLVYGYAAMTAA